MNTIMSQKAFHLTNLISEAIELVYTLALL